MDVSPESLKVADRYKLLIGAIVPRPIALVSTCDAAGRLNLAQFSFFAGVGSNPMTLLFCPANSPEGEEKDTLRNAKPVAEGGVGEFVVNIVPASIARAAAIAAEPLPFGESEFDLSGLTPAPCRLVRAARVFQSPASFECQTQQVIRTNPGQPAGGNIVIGRVVHVWIQDDIVNERWHIDAQKLDAVGRMGGLEYCRTRDRFTLPMGRSAIERRE